MKSFCFLVVVSCFLVGAFAETECEKHRERELESNIKVTLIPKCTPEGDYEALQCFEGSDFCMCWRPDGSHITNPSKNVKTCVCHVHRDTALGQAKKGMVGQLIPQCNDNGTYARKQCSGSSGYCWCTDEKGNRISEAVFGDVKC